VLAAEECPNEATLLDFVEGRLDARGRETIDSHIDRCPHCRSVLAALAHDSAFPPPTRAPKASGTRDTMIDAGFPIGWLLAQRFRVVRALGTGGMGSVYEAYDQELGQSVALKLLHPTVSSLAGLKERLRREIVLGRRVSHPNVCRVHDLGADGELLFLTMELVAGETLHDRIARGRVEESDAIDVLTQLFAGVSAAHDKGVVHRDLKPSNVMLAGDQVVITDFGLAIETAERSLDRGMAVGTPAYWAPEQASGAHATIRSDIYALGVISAELLGGRRPRHGELADLDHVPDRFRRAIARALATNEEDRHASVEAFRAALFERPSDQVLIGRESDLARLDDVFRAGAKLVTVLGAPGVGKTALTRRFVERSSFDVVYTDLSSITEPQRAAGLVAEALGGELTISDGDIIGAVGRALDGRARASERPVLLVLDNGDGIADDAQVLVAPWLEAAVRVMVSSRERLRLPSETCVEIEPLSLEPEAGSRISAAMALFEERARGVVSGFEIDDSNRADVDRIVRAVDGLPLAIELAAARVRLMSPKQMADRFDRRFDLLSARVDRPSRPPSSPPGMRRATPEATTLRATIGWSWDLLSPAEARTLRACTVFIGGFTVEAAEVVLDDPDAVEVLTALRDRSLLHAADASGESRMSMLTSIREFVREERDRAPIDSGVFERHTRYYRELGRALLRELDGSGAARASDRLKRDTENVAAAFDRAVAAADREAALDLALALDGIFSRRGFPQRHAAILDRALEVGRAGSRLETAVRIRRAALRAQNGDLVGARRDLDLAEQGATELADDQLRAATLIELSNHAWMIGAYERAVDLAQQAIARSGADAIARARAHVRASVAYCDMGIVEPAKKHAHAALEEARRQKDRATEAEALNAVGKVAYFEGDFDLCHDIYQEAVVMFRELGKRRREARMLGNLGLIASERDRPDEAVVALQGSIALARELGDFDMEVWFGAMLGLELHNLGDLDRALALYDDALARSSSIGAIANSALIRGYKSLVLQERREFEGALALLNDAIRDLEDAKNHRFTAVFQGCRSGLHHERGELEEALVWCERAVARGREVGDHRVIAIFLGATAGLEAELGRVDRAIASLDEAVATLKDDSRSTYWTELDVHRGLLDLARQRAGEPGEWLESARGRLARARFGEGGQRSACERSARVRWAVRMLESAIARVTGSGTASAKPSGGQWGPAGSHSTGRGGAAPARRGVS
jgi:non-specific serine/threonine protein kinase